MPQQRPIDPKHAGPRAFFRVVGPLLLIPGCLLMLVGIIDFLSKFGSMETPTMFLWGCTIGMLLIMVGGPMTHMGYMGRMARYMSEEVTPVATDTINYAVGQTRDSIRDVAQAVAEGIRGDAAGPVGGQACAHCGHDNDADARFCSQCGRPLSAGRACPNCRHENDRDARFCDNCGQALSD